MRGEGDGRRSAVPFFSASASMPNGFDGERGGRSLLAPSAETRRTHDKSSNTWSTSDDMLEQDDREDREPFVQEYNRLAKRVSPSSVWFDL